MKLSPSQIVARNKGLNNYIKAKQMDTTKMNLFITGKPTQ